MRRWKSLICLGAAMATAPVSTFAGDPVLGKNPGTTTGKEALVPKAVVVEEESGSGRSPFWRASAGVAVRSFGDVTFGSESGFLRGQIPNFVGNDSFRAPRVGPASGTADRRYGDGFVLIGPGVELTGLTQNYGYASSAQIVGTPDAATGVRYHAPGGSSRATTSSLNTFKTTGHDDLDEEAGVHLQLDWLYPVGENGNVGLQIGFDYFDIDGSSSAQTLTGLQSGQDFSVSVVDTFAFPGVVVAPSAPFNFPESTIGNGGIPMNPLLSNVPIDRATTTSKNGAPEVVTIHNRVDQKLEVDLYTLSFGVTAEIESERLFAALTAGITLNIADTDWRTTETLFANSRTVRKEVRNQDDQEIFVGGFVQGSLGVKITERTSISGFVRYDVADDLSASSGGNHYDVDLDGWSAGVAVAVRF